MLDVHIPARLTLEQAKAKTVEIKKAAAVFGKQARIVGRLLTEMHDCKGYEVMGYDSWKEYCENCLEYSRQHTYKLMNAAREEYAAAMSEEQTVADERRMAEAAQAFSQSGGRIEGLSANNRALLIRTVEQAKSAAKNEAAKSKRHTRGVISKTSAKRSKHEKLEQYKKEAEDLLAVDDDSEEAAALTRDIDDLGKLAQRKVAIVSPELLAKLDMVISYLRTLQLRQRIALGDR